MMIKIDEMRVFYIQKNYDQRKIWNFLANFGEHLKVISISNQFFFQSSPTHKKLISTFIIGMLLLTVKCTFLNRLFLDSQEIEVF
jgi:hypothetical protein